METVYKFNYLINSIKDFHIEPYDFLHIEKAHEYLSHKLRKRKK